MRTFSQEHWTASLLAWRDGEFSDEWKPFRHQAAMRGMIYPPEGTKWDSWEDDSPSQRAMLIRAIRESPDLLKQCIGMSRTWGEVIERLTRARDDWRTELEYVYRENEAERADRATHSEAVMTLAQIMRRIGDSV